MNKNSKILIACEESGAVTDEFIKLGFTNVWSCDFEPCSGNNPHRHIQGDVTPLLAQKWDMIIAFPPCTYLTVTGNRWFNVQRYGDKAVQRHIDRQWAIDFFMMFANAKCDKIAIENPVGVMSTEWRKADQIIQPYEFVDPFEKKTCLWLKGLPKLTSTSIVEPPKRKEFASGKTMPGWYADCWKLPKEERARLRSKTFQGIAKAMAAQWGGVEGQNETKKM